MDGASEIPGPVLEQIQAWTPVSRETSARLAAYAALLRRWNGAINLVSPKSLDDMARRHFLDSAQLIRYLPRGDDLNALHIVDLGSGAGFPGLVLGVLTPCRVTLIESDRRKCEFLRQVARETACKHVSVLTERIESAAPDGADIVTARALAPVSQLLSFAENILKPDGFCLFLKGNTLGAELTDAKKVWHIDSQELQSVTHPDGRVLRIDRFDRIR